MKQQLFAGYPVSRTGAIPDLGRTIIHPLWRPREARPEPVRREHAWIVPPRPGFVKPFGREFKAERPFAARRHLKNIFYFLLDKEERYAIECSLLLDNEFQKLHTRVMRTTTSNDVVVFFVSEERPLGCSANLFQREGR